MHPGLQAASRRASVFKVKVFYGRALIIRYGSASGSDSARGAALARSATQDLQALAARARLADGAMNINSAQRGVYK